MRISGWRDGIAAQQSVVDNGDREASRQIRYILRSGSISFLWEAKPVLSLSEHPAPLPLLMQTVSPHFANTAQ